MGKAARQKWAFRALRYVQARTVGERSFSSLRFGRHRAFWRARSRLAAAVRRG